MASDRALPFQSFSFTLLENRLPRTALRLRAPQEGEEFYRLVIQKGSATNPATSVERDIPVDTVLAFRDALSALGVFSWEEAYGDTTAPGSRRWTLAIVFEEGVFSQESKGGSDTPEGFDGFLEELYGLDFPRPGRTQGDNAGSKAPGPDVGFSHQGDVGRAIGDVMGGFGLGSLGSMSAGDLGAFSATKGAQGDYSYLKGLFGARGSAAGIDGMTPLDDIGDLGALGAGDSFDFDAIDGEEAARLFAEMQRNPEVMKRKLREEFRHLSPEEKNGMLDALAKMGFASRAWWERFFGF